MPGTWKWQLLLLFSNPPKASLPNKALLTEEAEGALGNQQYPRSHLIFFFFPRLGETSLKETHFLEFVATQPGCINDTK